MNIANYHKYFTSWNVETSTTEKDSFGGIIVGTKTRQINGYLSKSLTTTRDEDNIPQTVSGGILFVDPEIHLTTGDILNKQYQVIDYDRHPSHNEYTVKLLDKWGDNQSPTYTGHIIDTHAILTESGSPLQTENGKALLMEGD